MYEAVFELETITPLFMRGAEQGKAEFRSASVKGVIRWWFRALAGSYFGNNITELRKAECRVFGCAGGGETRRSSVVIRAELVESESRYTSGNRYESYFWFSQTGRNSKGFIPPETTLTLTLESHDDGALKLAALSLWAALHLGGFGSRSRKFAGSLRARREPAGDLDVGIPFVPGRDVEGFYRTVLGEGRLLRRVSSVLKSMGLRPGAQYAGPPGYPVLSENHAVVAVGRLEDSVSDVIESVGQWYLGTPGPRGRFDGGFRFKHSDRRIPHTIYNKYQRQNTWGNRPIRIRSDVHAPSERRPFLGLPIQFYKSFGYEHVSLTLDHWKANRRASGLLFTVNALKLEERGVKYFPVITLFMYRFLPGYTGPLRYRGGVFRKEEGRKRKAADVSGRLLILDGHHGAGDVEEMYVAYLHELARSISDTFTPVFGPKEVLQ